jgi:hypothetical protein
MNISIFTYIPLAFTQSGSNLLRTFIDLIIFFMDIFEGCLSKGYILYIFFLLVHLIESIIILFMIFIKKLIKNRIE